MKSVAVLLPYDYKLFSVATILEVFATVNRLWTKQNGSEAFDVTIIQSQQQIAEHGRSFQGHEVKSVHSRMAFDIVVLPAFANENLHEAVENNTVFIPWLKKQYAEGAEIASVCTGAYLFAASGLLNGRLATTHMDACPDMVIDFPTVFVKPGRTMTIDGRCMTSGGSTSSFQLLIFLVQKYCSNELAVKVSKYFAVDLDRSQQRYFSTFRPDYSHNDEMVKKIQRKIEANFIDITTLDGVMKDLPASRRNILRRFKLATGVPPIEYLQHIRIEKAKKYLEQTNLNISEIINETGYTDPKSFRKIFLKLTGMTASEYRNKLGVK